PPDLIAAFERTLVDNSDSATDAEEFNATVRLQMSHERQHFFDCLDERLCFDNLRSDMHLHAADRDIRQRLSSPVDLCCTIDSDAKLVLRLSGADIFMCICRNAGIHPNCYRGPLV